MNHALVILRRRERILELMWILVIVGENIHSVVVLSTYAFA
jgi:hypothetical protein